MLTPSAVPFWTAVAGVLASWLPANTVVLPGTMVASGATVSGFGKLQINAPASSLGPLLAAAAGSPPSDAAAVQKWTAIGQAIIDHLTTYGQANPVAFVSPASPVNPNPITGTGLLTITNPGLGLAMANAVGTLDAPGIAAWTTIGGLLLAHLSAFTQILPIAFVAPPGSGPLVGSGTVL